MSGAKHKLNLVLSQIMKSGKIDFDTVIMMASEAEEISEKIKEERQENNDHPDPDSEFKKRDLAGIEAEANRVKADAKKLGMDDKLTNEPEYPGLNPLAISVSNYGARHHKQDLGVPGTQTKKKCDKKPSDVHPGLEIVFIDYRGGPDEGWAVEALLVESADKKVSDWHIKFRPYGWKEGKTLAPKAYHDDCTPAYYIKQKGNCPKFFEKPRTVKAPARTVNGKNISARDKAEFVKGYPLCSGDYQAPIELVVGIDRISDRRRWVRAHLIHGDLGGKGLRWNLIPVPEYINNPYLYNEYENELVDLVEKGSRNGKLYWYEADVIYYQDSDNAVIGYYSDFVKELHVSYGELDKDTEGNWVFKTGKYKSFKFDKIPLRDDLAPNRVQG